MRGTFSGALSHANSAMPVNLRLLTVSPKKVRAGSLRMRTSTPTAFH